MNNSRHTASIGARAPRRHSHSWIAILVAALLGVLQSAPAYAEDSEPTMFESFDAAFGSWIVGPLATVMFWDMVFWDDSLPLGTLPAAGEDGLVKVGESEVVEYREGAGYVFKAVRTVAPDA